jgi:hypothetical protein
LAVPQRHRQPINATDSDILNVHAITITINKMHLNDVHSMSLKKVSIQLTQVLFDPAGRSSAENVCVPQDSYAIQCASLDLFTLGFDWFRLRWAS